MKQLRISVRTAVCLFPVAAVAAGLMLEHDEHAAAIRSDATASENRPFELGDNWPDELVLSEEVVLVESQGEQATRTIQIRNMSTKSQKINVTGKSCGCLAVRDPGQLGPGQSADVTLSAGLPMQAGQRLLVLDIGDEFDKSHRTTIKWPIQTVPRLVLMPTRLDDVVAADDTSVVISVKVSTATRPLATVAQPRLRSASDRVSAVFTVDGQQIAEGVHQTTWAGRICIQPAIRGLPGVPIRERIPIEITDGVASLFQSLIVVNRPAFREVPQTVLLRAEPNVIPERTVSIAMSPDVNHVKVIPKDAAVEIRDQHYNRQQHRLQFRLAATSINPSAEVTSSSVSLIPDRDTSQAVSLNVLVWNPVSNQAASLTTPRHDDTGSLKTEGSHSYSQPGDRGAKNAD
ncbi:hypothetical protein GC176_13825 [bacterium]|nr:hypothetical protein [bacterium]